MSTTRGRGTVVCKLAYLARNSLFETIIILNDLFLINVIFFKHRHIFGSFEPGLVVAYSAAAIYLYWGSEDPRLASGLQSSYLIYS